MDIKARSLLHDFVTRIKDATYDETTVYALLILLRDYYLRDHVIRSLADFIAHREKDRGDIHKYFVTIINEMKNADRGEKYKFTVREVYSEEQIANALNRVLVEHGYSRLTVEEAAGVMLCIVTLFQGVALVGKKKGKSGSPVATLGIAIGDCIRDKKIVLHGDFPQPTAIGEGDGIFRMPVLSSSYMPSVADELIQTPGPCKVVNVDGRLCLKLCSFQGRK